MAYIDNTFYATEFKGVSIPDKEFLRLADIASDLIDSICTLEIDSKSAPTEVKKAVAYEVEMLYLQGGVDAIAGMADGLTTGSESLGSYSVSRNTGGTAQTIMRSKDGIPISSLTISILRKAGYIQRWVPAWKYRNGY